MKLPEFEHHGPDSIEEVLSLLARFGDEAMVLAGGQSLVPLLAMRLIRPRHLVDVNRVPDLSAIEHGAGGITFGATVRERAAERSPVVRHRLPLLAEALPFVGHPAIRTRGTIGGTVAHADPAAEVPGVLAALDGSISVRSVRGRRTISAHDFFRGRRANALEPDECVVEVHFPSPDPSVGCAFQEVARRHGDVALAGVAAMVELDSQGRILGGRVALVGVGETPVRARAAEAELAGAEPTAETFAAVAQTATADLDPPSDVLASGAYRRHVAAVTVRRALASAVERARTLSGEQVAVRR